MNLLFIDGAAFYGCENVDELQDEFKSFGVFMDDQQSILAAPVDLRRFLLVFEMKGAYPLIDGKVMMKPSLVFRQCSLKHGALNC